jgi:phospholipid transport system substrate-binding protein
MPFAMAKLIWMNYLTLRNLTKMNKLLLKPLAAMSAGLVLLLSPLAANAGPVEEKFVQVQAASGLDILQQADLDASAKTAQFGMFIDEVVDARKIARFVLGKYARKLDKQILSDFQDAFEVYAKGIYQGNLTQYGGETFTVTGSVDRKPGDAVVASVISGGALAEPLKVRWRVRTKNGVSKVIDLEAFGIWLAVQQRSEITTYIANHGGKVEAATQMLLAKVKPESAKDQG